MRPLSTAEDKLQQAKVQQLDYCVAAYQLYHQSTILKIDTWNETLVHDSQNYRNEVLEAIRTGISHGEHHAAIAKYYPQGRFSHLEPIAQDYKLINPQEDVAIFDGEKYIHLKKQPWADNLGEFSICKPRTACSFRNIATVTANCEFIHTRNNLGGNNELYCFEGVTGQQGPEKEGLSSVMGFIHWDKTKGSVNIVFRGSRGGDPTRNFKDGLLSSEGNADWVTDMMFTEALEDATISKKGKLCSGFASTVTSCLPAITTILMQIYDKCTLGPTAIKEVTVTGHSLGGALATLMGSSLLYGNYINMLVDYFHSQAADNIKRASFIAALRNPIIYTYASPHVGNKTFVSQFDNYKHFHRILILSDPVTIGGRILSRNFARHPAHRSPVGHPSWYDIDSDMHEPNEIRHGLTTRTSPFWEAYGNFKDIVTRKRNVIPLWRDSFKWDHFHAISTMLVDTYLRNHHGAKRRFLPFTKGVGDVLNDYSNAYYRLNFDDDFLEIKDVIPKFSEDRGIVIVAYIKRFLDYLNSHIDFDWRSGKINFSAAVNLDLTLQCKFFIKNLRYFAKQYGNAATVVKYINYHMTVLTFLFDADSNTYESYAILKNTFKNDRLAPQAVDGTDWAGAINQVGAIQAVRAIGMTGA